MYNQDFQSLLISFDDICCEHGVDGELRTRLEFLIGDIYRQGNRDGIAWLRRKLNPDADKNDNA